MRTWITIARYHLIRPVIYLGLPWAIIAFSLAINLAIVGLAPASPDTPHHYTGGIAAIGIFFLVMGAFSIGPSLPFGLALGVSRRSYYAGTALLAVTLAAADGLALTALQAIERSGGGWGEHLYFFRVPYLLDGPWYLTWLTSTVALALLFAYGMWFAIVYRRWNLSVMLTFTGAQVTILVAAAMLITWNRAWAGTGHFFTALSAAGLTVLLAALTAALLAGGYFAARRVSV